VRRPNHLTFFKRGPTFIDYIDGLPPLSRNADGPFLMPVVERYKDMGTIVLGKVEGGSCVKGQSLLLMPNKVSVLLFTVHDSLGR
jgi:peptide chain release factor subunit 3